MNLKIALATALLLTGGTYASDAQQKPTVSQSATTAAKSFDKKIKEYQNADAAQSAALLAELKQVMATDMGTAKAEIASAADDATREKAMKKFENRLNAMNEANRLIDSGGEKAGIVTALKKYAQTL